MNTTSKLRHKSQPAISVLIVTRNRHDQLRECWQALQTQSFQDFQLIVVDQSVSPLSAHQVAQVQSQFADFTYLHMQQTGKSNGLNFGFDHCSAPLIAYTDDDCLPEKNWLKNILATFEKHPQVAAIFGMTLPYLPTQIVDGICPCTKTEKTASVFDQPTMHWQVGYGNNMAIKKAALTQLGGFRSWLGPGSIGSNAEDAELIQRLLINGYQLRYEPKCRVFHNRWLTKAEFQQQELSYLCGEAAWYGFLFLKKAPISGAVFRDRWQEVVHEIKSIHSFRQLTSFVTRVGALLRGGAVACFYGIKVDNSKTITAGSS